MGIRLRQSDTHIGKVSGLNYYYEQRLTLDTAAYAAGDVLADVFELPNVFRNPLQAVALLDIGVLDEDDQGASFDILFFKTDKFTLAAKNAAFNATDAEMRQKSYIGKVVSITSYTDLGGNRVSNSSGLNRVFRSFGNTGIWIATVSQGTGTYTAGGLTLSFSFTEL